MSLLVSLWVMIRKNFLELFSIIYSGGTVAGVQADVNDCSGI